MDHELGEQEQTDVVVGPLAAGLERLVDDVQQAQQVDEEEAQEPDGELWRKLGDDGLREAAYRGG